MSGVLFFGLVNTGKAHCQVGNRFRAGMLGHLETAAGQKKENVHNDYDEWLTSTSKKDNALSNKLLVPTSKYD